MFCTTENFILLYKQNVGYNLLVTFNLFFYSNLKNLMELC